MKTLMSLAALVAITAATPAVAGSPVLVQLVTPFEEGAPLRPVAANSINPKQKQPPTMVATRPPMMFQGMPRFEPNNGRPTQLCIDWTTVETLTGRRSAVKAEPNCWQIKRHLGANSVPSLQTPVNDFTITLTAELRFQ